MIRFLSCLIVGAAFTLSLTSCGEKKRKAQPPPLKQEQQVEEVTEDVPEDVEDVSEEVTEVEEAVSKLEAEAPESKEARIEPPNVERSGYAVFDPRSLSQVFQEKDKVCLGRTIGKNHAELYSTAVVSYLASIPETMEKNVLVFLQGHAESQPQLEFILQKYRATQNHDEFDSELNEIVETSYVVTRKKDDIIDSFTFMNSILDKERVLRDTGGLSDEVKISFILADTWVAPGERNPNEKRDETSAEVIEDVIDSTSNEQVFIYFNSNHCLKKGLYSDSFEGESYFQESLFSHLGGNKFSIGSPGSVIDEQVTETELTDILVEFAATQENYGPSFAVLGSEAAIKGHYYLDQAQQDAMIEDTFGWNIHSWKEENMREKLLLVDMYDAIIID